MFCLQRKYKFNWDLIGNLEIGRPNLGNTTRVEVYRLMQFAFRDVLEVKYGTEEADAVFYVAGKLAGTEFYEEFLSGITDFKVFISELQRLMEEMMVGILRIEEVDLEAQNLILTVTEDLDCSGLPELDYEVCTYDEGLIAGILECFTGKPYEVKEVDCWCTGDRTCRFRARRVAESTSE